MSLHIISYLYSEHKKVDNVAIISRVAWIIVDILIENDVLFLHCHMHIMDH